MKKFALLLLTVVCVCCAIFALTACKNEPKHEHNYGQWQADETYHWKQCTADGVCNDLEIDREMHSFNNENGQCEVCKFQQVVNFSYEEITENDAVVAYSVSVTNKDIVFVNIPTEYNGKPVTAIADSAFSECTGLTKITVPNNITSIGNNAFYGCTQLISVTLSEGVTSIGNKVFNGCTGLTNVTLPDSVTSIGSEAFRGCMGLTNVTLSNMVTTIGDSAFAYCSGLTSVALPNSVTSIGEYAFFDCTGLTNVTIGSGVTSIGDGAFNGCTGLTNVTLPNSVSSIGDVVFRGCTGLTSITLPSSIASIGALAFKDCASLTNVYITDLSAWCNIKFDEKDSNPLYYAKNLYLNDKLVTDLVIPNDVTTISGFAFCGYKCLTSVTLPNSITSIGWGVFEYCENLKSVTMGNGITKIDNLAFDNCPSLTSVYYQGTADEWCKISIGIRNSNLTTADLYYYSQTEPTESGNYWHYVDGVATPYQI